VGGVGFAPSLVMRILSYISTRHDFLSIEVEIALVPGLHQIQVLGLPDKLINESSKRILSALTHQGFRLPPGKQIVVNLFPNHLAKSSQGLDLALAIGILVECGAIAKDSFDFSKTHFYGALGLNGEVFAPADLANFEDESLSSPLVTGKGAGEQNFSFYELENLKSFPTHLQFKESKKKKLWERPTINANLKFSKSMAELLSIIAVGEHPTLLAGDAGIGKTTLVEAVSPLIRPPKEKEFFKIRKYWRRDGRVLNWRPVLQPHHSSSPVAMIGGRVPPRPGELTLAHTGILILDELLEFHPQVQSALREPMEKGLIQVSRGGERKIFPARSLILATTNLCLCGKFHPQKRNRCRCSSQSLRRYLERLSGPFLDRFSIFHLIFEANKKEKEDGDQVSQRQGYDRVSKAIEFASRRGQEKSNQYLALDQIIETMDPQVDLKWAPHTSNRRRKQSLFRVARTLADLSGSETIQREHLNRSSLWTTRDFHRLQDYGFECYF